MTNPRSLVLALALGPLLAAPGVPAAQPVSPASAPAPSRQQVLDTMKRATTFMQDSVSHGGGYVWAYLPDRSRRWGELEATPTMIWIQPPGTATVGHLLLDAYRATSDEFYYQAAARVATALIAAQHPAGGWNYVHDTAGEAALKKWYDTVGRNAWRLEEFQHYYGNATFDDGGTAESARFLLRIYALKKETAHKAALDRAIAFVLDSQYPNGAWPQRYPKAGAASLHGLPDYSAYYTFNDDVAAENIGFLLQAHAVLGEPRLLAAARKGMDAFVLMQQPAPQAGWGLQHTDDLKPAAARSYEPRALVTHTTAANVEAMIGFYELTGDPVFLARLPEALDWLDAVKLPAELARPGRTHPTFVEVGTNQPLFVHRRGSNVVNGEYYVDRNPEKTLGHYSSFRHVDVARLRARLAEAKALPAAELARRSPFAPGGDRRELPTYFTVAEGDGGRPGAGPAPSLPERAARLVADLNAEGYWLAPLGYTSHPYKGDGPKTPAPGDFSQTHVGDEYDTSPFRDEALMGISTGAFIRNMATLIRYLDTLK